MKKLTCMILAVILAAALCCTALAESSPRPEGGKKFETNWAIFGMTVEVFYEEEGYRVCVTSTDPYEHKGTEWEYSCFYLEDKDELMSVSSTKRSWSEDPETGDFIRGEVEYQGLDDEGKSTVFTVNADGSLIWQDGHGQDGADLVFTDIGKFMGSWISEDGKTWAEITWSDSEIGDEYGYSVFLHDGDDQSWADYSTHGLYHPETGKLETTGSVIISTLNAEGGYDTQEIPADPEEPLELIFSNPESGKILLERDNGIELNYDILGGFSQG